VYSKVAHTTIASLAKCSIGTVSNVLRCQQVFGQSTNPFGRRPRREPDLDAGDLVFVDELLDREPRLYLGEIQERLEENRGMRVSVATVHRALH
jgi:transposase